MFDIIKILMNMKKPSHSLRLCHIFWHVCKHYTLQKNISCTYLYLWSTQTIVTRIPRWTLAARTPFYVWSVTIHVTAFMKNYTQKINASIVPVLWVWSSLNLFKPVFVNMFVKKNQQTKLPTVRRNYRHRNMLMANQNPAEVNSMLRHIQHTLSLPTHS